MKLNNLTNLPNEGGNVELYEHVLTFAMNDEYYFTTKLITDNNYSSAFTANTLYTYLNTKYGSLGENYNFINASGIYVQKTTNGYRHTSVIGIRTHNSANTFTTVENRYLIENDTVTVSFGKQLGNMCSFKNDKVVKIL